MICYSKVLLPFLDYLHQRRMKTSEPDSEDAQFIGQYVEAVTERVHT